MKTPTETPEIKLIGATTHSVEFQFGNHRVAAFRDGDVKMFDDSAVTEVEPTDLVIKTAKNMVRKHLKTPHTFQGRAMSGAGVDY